MVGEQRGRDMVNNFSNEENEGIGHRSLFHICDVIKQNQSEVGNIDFEI